MSGQPMSERLKVTLVVAFYMVAALVMVFVNKAVLNSSPNLPLLMLLIQFIIAVICLHASALISPKIDIPKSLLTWDMTKQLLPILISNVLGLTFNTFCLRGVDASYFQIARGLVLPLTITVTSLVNKDRPSTFVILSASIVTLGFFIGVIPSSTSPTSAAKESSGASFSGLLFGVLSSFMTAVHALLIKKSLPIVNNSTIQLAYWTNASAALILIPFVIFNGEVSSVWASLGYGQFTDPVTPSPDAVNNLPWDWKMFVFGCIVTGVVGFLLCVAGLLSIKITSPVTHMFSSAVRSVLQTVLGVLIFNDIMNGPRLASIFTILGGSMYYTWIKHQEQLAKEARAAAQPDTLEDIEEGLLQNKHENRDGDYELQGRRSLVFSAEKDDDEDHK